MHQGKCRIGLSPDELEDLATAGTKGKAHKCSTREMSTFLMRSLKDSSLWGATTVASTMKLAHLAGISTFVTGGSGGVHRGGEDSLDVSADLTELGRTPVVVVSAGIKSILDIQVCFAQVDEYMYRPLLIHAGGELCSQLHQYNPYQSASRD